MSREPGISKSHSPHHGWIAPIVFFVLTLIALGDGLFAPAHRVIGSPKGDLTMQFLSWRDFGFSEIRHGNLPLWNPHVFGGAPYLAGFQSALFYPPNWLHLILPLARAISWIIALHVFAAGYFTYFWCRRRASIAGSILAGAIFMFCGPYFLHVFPGHLPHIAVIVWIPLIFLSIDGLIEETHAMRWLLLGTIAIAMQVLAGHPQYVYYTAIVATIYLIALLIAHRGEKSPREIGWKCGGFIGMYIAAAAISAIQLLPGIAAASLTVRSGGLSYGMAGTFSLPPENFLTALIPNVFGPIEVASQISEAGERYIGRGYLWEMSLFVSVTGFILALIGAIRAEDKRHRWVLLAMIAICIALALGRHTPLYSLMYRIVPKYNSFRGTVKFAAPAACFVAMLAAIGFDRVRAAPKSLATIIAASSVLVVLVLIALTIKLSLEFDAGGLWGDALGAIASSQATPGESELFTGIPATSYSDLQVIGLSADAAAYRAMIASFVGALVLATIIATRFHRSIVYVLPLIAMIEMIVFARGAMSTTSDLIQLPETWKYALQQNKPVAPDARVLALPVMFQNAGMTFGYDDVWGYDPGVLKRYAELIAHSQGADPDKVTQYVDFHGPDVNIFRALRCSMVLLGDPLQPVAALPAQPLATALLVRNYEVIAQRDQLFTRFSSNAFDPTSSVLLEAPPSIIPVKGESIGDVQIVGRSTDSLEMQVDIATPAILLITNNYTPEWRVRSLDALPTQASYTIVPANWTQQAIPLSAGKHHLTVEYSPISFRVGRWISLIALLGLVYVAKRSVARRGYTRAD